MAPAIVLAGLSAAIAALLHLTLPWTPRHPNAVEPLYVVDPAAGKAWRESAVKPDAWTLSVLTAEGGAMTKLPDPAFGDDPAAAAAPVSATPAPVAVSATPDGQVTVTAAMHPGAAELSLALRSPGGISDVRVNGKPVSAEQGKSTAASAAPAQWAGPNQWGRVLWAAPEGYTLTFHTNTPAALQVETAEIYSRWLSVKPLPPMPAKDQPWDMSGSSLVLGRVPVSISATVKASGS